MTFTIADDYDPDGDISAKTNPVTAYRTYLGDVRGGMVGDMGFTLDDFKNLHRGTEEARLEDGWKKIFETVTADHHEMPARRYPARKSKSVHSLTSLRKPLAIHFH